MKNQEGGLPRKGGGQGFPQEVLRWDGGGRGSSKFDGGGMGGA